MTKYYENFQLGKEYMRVPFWRAQHLLYRKLNPSGPRLGFVWTNLIKIDHHKDRPPKDIEDQICTAFPVLPLEIQIAKPDVVVFFTGPRYDARLKKTFEGLTFEPICGYKVRTLARVVHKNLPYNSFRTYHPSYIVRSLNLPEIVDKIVASIS